MSITAFAVEPTNLKNLKGHPVLVMQDFVNLSLELDKKYIWKKEMNYISYKLQGKYVANDIIIVC